MTSPTATVRPGSFSAWLEAVRPRTLPASAAPVILGFALAAAAGGAPPALGLACLAVAVSLQIAANLANDSPFGLVAGVHTSNIDAAMAMAERLRVGQVWINSFAVGLDVEFPFGGYKLSGFGREKGLEALSAYQQIKNICVHHPIPS